MTTKVKTRFVKFPSIEQYRQIVKTLSRGRFSHINENNQPVFKPPPTLDFTGTVKIHGTNAGVVLNTTTGEMRCQKRGDFVDPVHDNAGFAFFVESHKEQFMEMLYEAKSRAQQVINERFNGEAIVCLYGEWAGSSIQKGVAVTELPKQFYIFGLKVAPIDKDNDKTAVWLDYSGIANHEIRVYNMLDDFPTYKFTLDFGDKESRAKAEEYMSQIVDDVEKECPVGKRFGVSGVGEGVVWVHDSDFGRVVFKTKGEKHKVSGKNKGKNKVEVAPEVLESIDKFVEYSVTENRLRQGVQELFGTMENTTMKDIGKLVKWMQGDILKEEMDVLVENHLAIKQVNGPIAQATVKWFKDNF